MHGTIPWTGSWWPVFATSEKLAIQTKKFEAFRATPLHCRSACQLGLLVNAPRPSCLRLMPRLNSTRAEIEQELQWLAEALEACRAG
jgi:acetylornithine/succinyldiaminopimelate/putrescine aminotransferase